MQYLNSHKYSNCFLHFICKFFGFHLQSYSHTVVLHKAKCRKRGSTQNAHPRYGFRANIRFEQEIQSYRNATSENRKNELSERQSKKTLTLYNF